MKAKALTLGAVIGTAALFAGGDAVARDRIQIVGSSTVFPYTQAVSEEFSSITQYSAPVVESTGTGGGMKIFCEGVGEGTPDITGASRAMKQSEWEACANNGVGSVTEVQIGSDGLSIAVSRQGQQLDLTKEEIYRALASEIPVDGELKPNPYQRWSEINSELPDIRIQVFGPPPTSGTRDAFVELVMHEGCEATDYAEALKAEGDEDAYDAFVEQKCSPMRQDGPFIEAGENDNLIVQRLEADSGAYGIFGYSFLYENQDKLQAVAISGVQPTAETIESGEYGVSRPLFFYVKNAHRGVIPGLQEFVEEYVSEAAMGPGGYLEERGLVPLSDERREEVREATVNGTEMTRNTN